MTEEVFRPEQHIVESVSRPDDYDDDHGDDHDDEDEDEYEDDDALIKRMMNSQDDDDWFGMNEKLPQSMSECQVAVLQSWPAEAGRGEEQPVKHKIWNC